MILHHKVCKRVTRSQSIISWERVNKFVGNEDELGILDTDDQTLDKQSTVGQREHAQC